VIKTNGSLSKISFSQPHLDSISTSLLSRLNIICKKRFNCTFKYYSFTEYSEIPLRPLVVRTLLEKNSHVIINGSLLLSMRSQGRLFGYVEVFSEEHLNPWEVDQLKELLEFSLGSVFECMGHLSDIRRLENAILLSNSPVNVFQMSSQPQFSDELTDIRAQKMGVQLVRRMDEVQRMIPVLILAQSNSDIQKMALSLHELSNYHFFVHFEHLSPDMRFRASDFADLSRTTVLISDLSNLKDKAILDLTDFISSSPQSTQPRFIFGMNSCHPDLQVKLPNCLVNLLKKRCLFQLKMNQSFEYLRDRYLVERFEQSIRALQNPDNVSG
jgi:hypothetical protein